MIPEIIQLQFKDLLFNRCLGGWVGKTVRILIQWWLLLWVQIPLEATFFHFLKLSMSILYRNVRFVLKTKNSSRCVIHRTTSFRLRLLFEEIVADSGLTPHSDTNSDTRFRWNSWVSSLNDSVEFINFSDKHQFQIKHLFYGRPKCYHTIFKFVHR